MKTRARDIRFSQFQEAKAGSKVDLAINGVFKAGGAVRAHTLLYKTEPQYTEEARAMALQGTVVVTVEIGPDGVPRNLRVRDPLGLGLDEKAIEAIQQWRFNPGTKDGQPVSVAASIEVNFRLL